MGNLEMKKLLMNWKRFLVYMLVLRGILLIVVERLEILEELNEEVLMIFK